MTAATRIEMMTRRSSSSSLEKPCNPPSNCPESVLGTVGSEPASGSDDIQVGDGETTPRLSTARIVVLAGVMTVTSFLGASSTSSVTLLIPAIARDLDASELKVQWVSSAYTLSFACGLLFSGRIGDIFERRNLYVLCSRSDRLCHIRRDHRDLQIVLCVTRAISGLGLAIASPAIFGIIGVNVRHEPARTVVFAAFGLGMPIGGAFGQIIGGLMASIGKGGWSYLFFLLAGMAVLLIITAFIVVPTNPPPAIGCTKDRRIDWVGGILVTAAVSLFAVSLTESGLAPDGWRTPHVPALFVVSLLLMTAFVCWSPHLEHKTSYPPIVNMSLFVRHSGMIGITCGCAFLISISIYGWVYTTTIFYQKYKLMTPLGNAVTTLTNTIVGAFAAAFVMFLAPRVRVPYLMGGSCILSFGSCVIYALWPEGTVFWALEFPAQLIQPWGICFVFGLGNILVYNLVKQNEQSIGGALFQTSAQIGMALGICLTSLICSEIAEDTGNVLQGVRASFWFTAAVGGLVVVLSFLGFRNVQLAKDVGRN